MFYLNYHKSIKNSVNGSMEHFIFPIFRFLLVYHHNYQVLNSYKIRVLV